MTRWNVPLKSKAQLRYLFAAQARKEIPAGTAEKFVKETPRGKLKRLPERVKPLARLAKAKKK